jgi:hypothetical protein
MTARRSGSCVGKGRCVSPAHGLERERGREVLDALAFTYQRKFKDQWEFVEYAEKHQPQLDLLTPPKRPQQP